MMPVAIPANNEIQELHEPPQNWESLLSPRLSEVLQILNEAFDFSSMQDPPAACDGA